LSKLFSVTEGRAKLATTTSEVSGGTQRESQGLLFAKPYGWRDDDQMHLWQAVGIEGEVAPLNYRGGLMPSFTIRGGRNGSRVHVTWTDGALTGDPPTVDLLHIEAELVRVNNDDHLQSWSDVLDTLGGMPGDPLTEPAAAWLLIRSVFDTIQSGEGDLPPDAAAELHRRRSEQ
jgi:hypothetical protein